MSLRQAQEGQLDLSKDDCIFFFDQTPILVYSKHAPTQTDFKNPSKKFYSMRWAALWTLTIWQQFCWLNYNVLLLLGVCSSMQYICICESEFKSFLSCVKPNTITKMTSNDSRWNAEYTFLYTQFNCVCFVFILNCHNICQHMSKFTFTFGVLHFEKSSKFWFY